MRKIICVILCVVFISFVFAGCGSTTSDSNSNNQLYTHIHFFDKTEGYCATVTSDYVGTVGITIKTKEYGSVFLPHGTYQLFEDVCPYCS